MPALPLTLPLLPCCAGHLPPPPQIHTPPSFCSLPPAASCLLSSGCQLALVSCRGPKEGEGLISVLSASHSKVGSAWPSVWKEVLSSSHGKLLYTALCVLISIFSPCPFGPTDRFCLVHSRSKNENLLLILSNWSICIKMMSGFSWKKSDLRTLCLHSKQGQLSGVEFALGHVLLSTPQSPLIPIAFP